MKIAVTGASGFVGSRLVPFLERQGHHIIRLVRSNPGADRVYWNPVSGEIDREALEGCDAAIHLAGESVASGRWTRAKKEKIVKSRVKGTRLFAGTLSALQKPPQVVLSASAIGYYGQRGDEVLNEESALGHGFLARTGQAWEGEVKPLTDKGIRVVMMRIGLILGPSGGALAKMLPPFRLGMGGPLGNGKQYMSWIALEDILGAIEHVLVTPSLSGPVNFVAPRPVTNLEFTRVLARVLSRPAVFPAPAFLLRILLGEFADELLLASTRVLPKRLDESGYVFRFPNLEKALRYSIGKA